MAPERPAPKTMRVAGAMGTLATAMQGGALYDCNPGSCGMEQRVIQGATTKEDSVFHLDEMIGKSLVSTATGERIGTVSDGLLDAAGTRLLALVVGKGMLAAEHVVPLTDVHLVGPDAVLVRTGEHVVTANEWRKSDVAATRCSALKGRSVVTEDGRLLGQVSGLGVDEETGALQAIEVEQRSLAGLRHHRVMIEGPPVPRVGPDAVVVANESLPDQADPSHDL